MKKATKAAIFVTAAAALYGAAAYGVTRTLMDVAMKREAPKALKNKGSAQLTGEKRDEPYREAQRAAAKKLASSETETVLLENKIKVRLYVDDVPPIVNKRRGGKNEKDAKKDARPEEQEEKLTPDIYTYKKEEIKRMEKRRDRSKENRDNANIFAGMDAATKKEMEELMKDE